MGQLFTLKQKVILAAVVLACSFFAIKNNFQNYSHTKISSHKSSLFLTASVKGHDAPSDFKDVLRHRTRRIPNSLTVFKNIQITVYMENQVSLNTPQLHLEVWKTPLSPPPRV